MTGDWAQSELSMKGNHDIGTCPRCHLEPSIGGSLFLEVHTNGGEEGAGVGGVEVVVRDVGEAEIIAQLGIEEIVLHAATHTDTAIETLEAFIIERAIGLAHAEILNLATNAGCHIAAHEGLEAEHGVELVLILEHHGQFEVIEAVSELVAGIGALAALLDVREAGLEVHGRVIAQLHAYNGAYIEARLGGAAIEVLIVRMNRGEAYTQAKAVVHLIGVTRHAGRLVTRRRTIIIMWPAILSEGWQREREAQKGNHHSFHKRRNFKSFTLQR